MRDSEGNLKRGPRSDGRKGGRALAGASLWQVRGRVSQLRCLWVDSDRESPPGRQLFAAAVPLAGSGLAEGGGGGRLPGLAEPLLSQLLWMERERGHKTAVSQLATAEKYMFTFSLLSDRLMPLATARAGVRPEAE